MNTVTTASLRTRPADSLITLRQAWIVAALLCLAYWLANAPTLIWTEMQGGSENLVIGAALETVREGHWLVPELNGEPRIAKPPIATWVAAVVITPDLLAALDHPDAAVRGAAYDVLAFRIRATALAFAAAWAAITALLARRFGPAAIIATTGAMVSNLLVLRYGRAATTDLHLAFWVTLTNIGLLKWNLDGPSLKRGALVGVGLGLAFMSKGPVALAFTVVPALVYQLWLRIRNRRRAPLESPSPAGMHPRQSNWPPAVLATVVALAIALPWPLLILARVPHVMYLWWAEVSREGVTDHTWDPWYTHGILVALLLPWAPLLVGGCIAAARWLIWENQDPTREDAHERDVRSRPYDVVGTSREGEALVFHLLLLVVPVLILSCVRDKSDRYLVPLAAPAAVLIGWMMRQCFFALEEKWQGMSRWRATHWTAVAIVCIGFPIVAAVPGWTHRVDGGPWLTRIPATSLAVAVLVAIGIAAICERRRWGGVVVVAITCVLSWLTSAAFMYGYGNSADGQSNLRELADSLRASHGDAPVYYYDPRPNPKPLPSDLGIYLNRTVRVLAKPQDVAEADAVIVMLQREAEPVPAVAGWQLVNRLPTGRRWWCDFTRVPMSPTTQDAHAVRD